MANLWTPIYGIKINEKEAISFLDKICVKIEDIDDLYEERLILPHNLTIFQAHFGVLSPDVTTFVVGIRGIDYYENEKISKKNFETYSKFFKREEFDEDRMPLNVYPFGSGRSVFSAEEIIEFFEKIRNDLKMKFEEVPQEMFNEMNKPKLYFIDRSF